MSKRWYVVHAYSGYEKQVMKSLQERIALSGLEQKFGEILVPAEEVVEMRAGKKRRSERKFFPGYVLVEMDLDDSSWHLVKETPVLGFIGGKADEPAQLATQRQRQFSEGFSGTENVTPKTIFEPGELVRVIDGPSTTLMEWWRKLITRKIASMSQ